LSSTDTDGSPSVSAKMPVSVSSVGVAGPGRCGGGPPWLRQCLAVQLAVGRERQRVEHHELDGTR